MKVLIAGGAGEIEKYLTKDFLECGHEVVLDQGPKPQEMERLPIAYFQGSLTDGALVREIVQGTEVIVNLAWSFADEPHTIFEEDIKGHLHPLERASSFGVKRLVYTSTATVYGRAVLHPVTETHPCLLRTHGSLFMRWVSSRRKSSAGFVAKNEVSPRLSCVSGGHSVTMSAGAI